MSATTYTVTRTFRFVGGTHLVNTSTATTADAVAEIERQTVTFADQAVLAVPGAPGSVAYLATSQIAMIEIQVTERRADS